MTERATEDKAAMEATVVSRAADGERRQVWVMVAKRDGDSLEWIEGIEIGAPLVICRAVRRDGRVILESGDWSADGFTRQLLREERCGRA